MSKKSIFKTETVPFEFDGEKYSVDVQRVHITAGAINAYRTLYNGLPGMKELQLQAADLMELQDELQAAQRKAAEDGLSEEDAAAEMMKSVGNDAIKQLLAFTTEQGRIEAAAASELFHARMDVLVPAIKAWSIEELELPASVEGRKALLEQYGPLGEAIIAALWEWYSPTTASSETGEKKTPKAATTKQPSSTPATASLESLPPSS